VAAEKRWRLVCYDVRDEKRYRTVYKIIRGAGHSVQYSVFRCRIDDLETERLRWRLSKVMDVEDALLIVDLCPSCAKRVISRNHVEGWAEEPPTLCWARLPRIKVRPPGASRRWCVTPSPAERLAKVTMTTEDECMNGTTAEHH
jgi:CRISPR-associated protein Cas2